MDELTIQMIDQTFSVCKVENYDGIDIEQPFVFTGSTDEEKSLVCPESMVPSKTIERDDGWRGFRIVGQLDFSFIGILSRISEILASNKIGIFAVSTYNTDYILVKKENYEKALDALKSSGYKVVSAGVFSEDTAGAEEALEVLDDILQRNPSFKKAQLLQEKIKSK